MDLLTILLILLFVLIVLLFIYFYTNVVQDGIPFMDTSNRWSKLQDEHVGILSNTHTLSRYPLRYSEQKELDCNRSMEHEVRLGYGIMEKERDRVQYLVPTEDIQSQLNLAECQPDIHVPVKKHSDSEIVPMETSNLKKAMSTDSLDSTGSCADTALEAPTVSLILTYHEPSQMLSVQVEKLTDVCADLGHVWMLFFLLPHPKPLWRTEARVTPASCLEYSTIFQQCVRKTDIHKIALLVQLYSSRNQSACIIGQCRLRLKDVNIAHVHRDVPVALSLQPNRPQSSLENEEPLGDVLVLVSFFKDNLTVVVSKVKELDPRYRRVFIRLYFVIPMTKTVKKKTSQVELKDGEAEIAESMFFAVNKKKMATATIRLSIVCEDEQGTQASIGHVTIGPKTSGKELGHFTRAISHDGNHLATWHHIKHRQTKLQ